jgi:hypothetical protein
MKADALAGKWLLPVSDLPRNKRAPILGTEAQYNSVSKLSRGG